MTQQCPHHGIVGTLLGAAQQFENTIHHQCLVPELIIKCRPSHPVVIPVVTHHRQIDPLQGQLSDLLTQIWTRPYLLIQQVMLSIAGMHMESSIFTRDLVPHGVFESVAVDQRHCNGEKGC